MSKLKIAFIFTHQIQYFTNILQALHERGNVDLRVYYAHYTNKFKDKGFNRVIAWDNQVGNEFPSIVFPDSGSRPFDGFGSSFTTKLFQELSAYDPDVVHLNGYGTAIQWVAWTWAILNRKLIVARGDGDTLVETSSNMRVLNRALARRFTRRLDQVFYQGKENKLYWKQRGVLDSRMTWIPCVPDNRLFQVQAFADSSARDRFRADAGTEQDDCAFVVAGKLDNRKRPADALEAMARLKGQPCKLWFLGSGPLESDLSALATSLGVENAVRWWGFRNVSELPEVLQAADVLLHPSQRDPWPYSILEGAMSGLALLLSDKTGSHPDLIEDAGAGLTFKCADIGDLAAQMTRLTGNSELRKRFAAASIERCKRHTEAVFCSALEGSLLALTADAAAH